jgi:hypothetical protein
MDKPHKQVVTTHPVAIKKGQTRLHVAEEHPWHRKPTELVSCPNCEVVFIATEDFPKAQLLADLQKQHDRKENHPDYIPSQPAWTHTGDCDCEDRALGAAAGRKGGPQ